MTTTTQTQKALRAWRVLQKLWSDADYRGTTPNVVQSGKTTATDEEMKNWTGKDADLTPDNMQQFSGNGHEEGSYTLQVLDGEDWHDITGFSLETFTCPDCKCEFEAVVSSKQIDDDFVPACACPHFCCAHDHEG